MQVEIWSDVVCPWCAIGKARFDRALAGFEHRDRVEVRFRSFELDPDAPPRRPGSYVDHLAAKYGTSAAEAQTMIDRVVATANDDGLELRFDRAQPGNTFDAHRLLHLAADRGVQPTAKAVLLDAHFTRGLPIGDRDTLVTLGTEVGLDADEVARVLDGDTYADAVRADEQQAAGFGIRGVPFFVLDRTYAVSGAQPVEVLESALAQAWQARQQLPMVPAIGASGGGGCADGSCACG
ncbi:DsbA family oxidoreductase [Nitriliruptoraceae bacterium ZYF776]|nr:DsbA family oxidoreductase [Profundirhabdus halotolerans]